MPAPRQFGGLSSALKEFFNVVSQILGLIVSILAITYQPACTRRDPKLSYEHARQTYMRGDIEGAGSEAESGYREFHGLSPDWSWRFAILRARVLYRQSQEVEALKLLSAEVSPPPSTQLEVQALRLESDTYVSLRDFAKAEQKLAEAEGLCSTSPPAACGDLVSARGMFEMRDGHYTQAQHFFERALASARTGRDEFLEAVALLNLSYSADVQAHFDEALDWANLARGISLAKGYAGVAQKALGNMGWAYHRLGDREKAEAMFIEAAGQARGLKETTSEAGWLAALGYAYLDVGQAPRAKESFQRSLDLSMKASSREDIIDSLTALAFVSEQTDKLDDAKRYASQALAKAQEDKNGRDEVYPLLVQGRIAARQHDTDAAEKDFHGVADSQDTPVFLKWEAERSLARLYEDENQPTTAEHEYRTALTTFEAARSELRHEDSRLPFLTNANRIYDDYIHFLVAQGKTAEALQVAEYSRARTLSEGLGVLKKGTSFAPDLLNAQAIARHAGGTILFYWLGEKQSYLWVITPRATRLFTLNATSAEIEAAVHAYRSKLEGPPEILEASNDGSALYKMLVGPAQDFLTKEALARNNQVFIIPDGSLNSLNFETLIPPQEPTATPPSARTPAPKHYWIEDVTITSAGSLHLLAAAQPAPKRLAGKLLLIGNPVSPTPAGPENHGDNPYPDLPYAAAEMHSIERHFQPQQQTVFAREQATPAALNGHPGQFSYIHFVAHGSASRTSPLDSAIILSRDPASKAAAGADDSFKLYARDIVHYPLHAELVTISACNGAGKRSYSGEGLVGLSWAFLRAGAHNVVGALWDVSSISSAQLMDDFYGELQKGKTPSAALRAAKLTLLHSKDKAFHSPFYWAPFQLYTGA